MLILPRPVASSARRYSASALATAVLACAGCATPKGPPVPQAMPEPQPDKIAFVSIGAEEGRQIYTMNPDGSDQRRVTQGVGLSPSIGGGSPPWSPDGRRIACTASAGQTAGIYVVNADGSGMKRLTESHLDQYPSWSPDGTKIAFMRGAGEPPGLFTSRWWRADIFTMNVDGAEQKNLTKTGRLTTNTPGSWPQPVWSPDGSSIAFWLSRQGESGLCVMNADGTEPRGLTHGLLPSGYRSSCPAWCPDGRRIAFVYDIYGSENQEVYVINADGTGLRNLTDSPGSDRGPRWSPDGREVAFASDRDGDFDIYVMNADGTDPRSLTENSVIDMGPTWSPDGTKLAFESERDGNYDVYVVNADGSEETRLTDNPGYDGQAWWSPVARVVQ